ncbi:hypothetical protein GCM10011348_19740 [Marinobacterium nitratireducens]|uniref:Uncharacterized protein n=1 Tax=Marinobacterium nitratireducens TaxID=518897 RepID=A0A917ZG34_9GAMM|nr:hypothetical protein [Marinobacterium nitratireducens]GGO81212.1 hypothetical protein GCM10011348_19740 [Marinobacterium nitratireducens]
MKSYLFSTENGRGGVILCDIETFEEAVDYLRQRFDGVIKVEQGRTLWTLEAGFGEFVPVKPADLADDDGASGAGPGGGS